MGFKKGTPKEDLVLGRLEDLIASDNPVRLMDLVVENIVPHLGEDINDVGHNKVGASAYNRKELLKLLIYGYQNRLSSSRLLERETYRNVEVIWLMGNLHPDHKTISDFRRSHGEQIRQVLRQFNWFLKNKGYIEGERISIDGMKTKANANRNTLSEEKINKRIDKRLAAIDRQISAYLKHLELNDAVEDKQENLELLAIQEAKALQQIAQLQQEIQDLIKKRSR